MAQSIQDIMQPNPVCLTAETSVAVAASAMRDSDIGDVMVESDGQVCGIVTDRDIVVRVVAARKTPGEVKLGEICSRDLSALSPSDTVERAVQVMRDKAVRRLPVLDNGRAVGLVSLGDLALEHDPRSALADISAAPGNT